MKKIDYRHYICIGITVVFLFCAVWLFRSSFVRLITAIKDLCTSVAYNFCFIFGISNGIAPTVNIIPPNGFISFLPYTFAEFKTRFARFGRLLIDKTNLIKFFGIIPRAIIPTLTVILVLVPLILVMYFLFRGSLKQENNDYNKNSKLLALYLRFSEKVISPVKRFFVSFFAFIKGCKAYKALWLIMWLVNFNAITIAIELVAYYFYFMVSLDVFSIYTQIYKLVMDISVVFRFVPLCAWCVVCAYLLMRFRKKVALSRLREYENRNCKLINSLPIVSMIVGTMGKKKTTTLTDMALSQSNIFRNKSFELLLENDLKFPNFPWINLENAIKRAVKNHTIYNLATCKRFIYSKMSRFRKRLKKADKCPYNAYSKLKRYLFDYDYERFGFSYDDHLKVVLLDDVLVTYTQLYFIYIIQSSLLVSNFSIREDNILQDVGNFPLWDSDFFSRDSRLIDSFSRHAHILDFDSLRLGKKVLEDNEKSNAIEFGVILITEGGKERGNMLDMRELKKNTDETSQKNDMFNSWLKMVRHSATVDNFPFVKVIIDEQRPESMGADVRELCEIVHICETYDTKLAMPFFFIEEFLYSLVFHKFANLYYNYRFTRSDNTLFMYLVKSVVAKFHSYYTRVYNNYSYMQIAIETEDGKLDGKKNSEIYYLSPKKIYAKRFSTDCLSEFFTDKAMKSSIGINDLEEYETERASIPELESQHSYFIKDLMNLKK